MLELSLLELGFEGYILLILPQILTRIVYLGLCTIFEIGILRLLEVTLIRPRIILVWMVRIFLLILVFNIRSIIVINLIRRYSTFAINPLSLNLMLIFHLHHSFNAFNGIVSYKSKPSRLLSPLVLQDYAVNQVPELFEVISKFI